MLCRAVCKPLPPEWRLSHMTGSLSVLVPLILLQWRRQTITVSHFTHLYLNPSWRSEALFESTSSATFQYATATTKTFVGIPQGQDAKAKRRNRREVIAGFHAASSTRVADSATGNPGSSGRDYGAESSWQCSPPAINPSISGPGEVWSGDVPCYLQVMEAFYGVLAEVM